MAWDEASAFAFTHGGRLPDAAMLRARGALERVELLRSRETVLGAAGLEVRYVGRDRWARNDVATRYGAIPLTSRAVASRWGLRRRPFSELEGADLAVVEILRDDADAWRREGWLVAPHFVAASVDLRIDDGVLWDHERRRRARRIESELSMRIDEGGETFDAFYDRMYVPTTRQRFGPEGYLARRLYLRRLASAGFLLYVDDRDGPIAAALIAKRASSGCPMDVRVWGVDASGSGRTRYAHEALFVLAIREARRRGAPRLGFGLSYPYANDGALRFKKRWGARMDPSPQDPRCFALRAFTDAGAAQLAHHQLIFELDGALFALGGGATPGVRPIAAPAHADDLARLAQNPQPGGRIPHR